MQNLKLRIRNGDNGRFRLGGFSRADGTTTISRLKKKEAIDLVFSESMTATQRSRAKIYLSETLPQTKVNFLN